MGFRFPRLGTKRRRRKEKGSMHISDMYQIHGAPHSGGLRVKMRTKEREAGHGGTSLMPALSVQRQDSLGKYSLRINFLQKLILTTGSGC